MRDYNIQKSFKREVNLKTKVITDKSKFTRKVKHKNKAKQIDSFFKIHKVFSMRVLKKLSNGSVKRG